MRRVTGDMFIAFFGNMVCTPFSFFLGCASDLLLMAQDIPRMSQILSLSSPKYTKVYRVDAIIELLKEKANALLRKSLFSDALSVYLSILQQFGNSTPPFTRVILCNIAACFVEL